MLLGPQGASLAGEASQGGKDTAIALPNPSMSTSGSSDIFHQALQGAWNRQEIRRRTIGQVADCGGTGQ